MSETTLRVYYKDGEPHAIRYGMPTASLAYMRGSTAAISYDNAGSTDFVKEVKKLPFVQAVEEP